MVRANPVARSPRAGTSRPLAAYRRKRNLRHSGEPAGASATSPGALPTFVIQKHDATQLHYDFRLEAGGVLKSWAVPKGLPARIGDKALAIEVEDHPLDYGGFEGTIPEGNYGAGTVMLWDRGVYVLEGDYDAAYRKGHLHVALAGEKLRGEWTLVRMRPRPGGKKTSWLIVKNRDSGRLASVAAGKVARDVSILTGRSMAGIASGRDGDEPRAVRLKKKSRALRRPGARPPARRSSSNR
jgi:bifunctional non-homologous end joining protein LigD